MTSKERDQLIIENSDIIERLAKVRLSMVDRDTGEVFRVENKQLVETGKFVNTLPIQR